MRTLALTSPVTRGPDVTRAQARLNGLNFLKRDFLDSDLDGVFGEATARACKRAKFWLGYSEKELHGSYGDALDGFLSGRKKLGVAMRLRRRRRLKRAKQTPVRVKAYRWLAAHLGARENPAGSNRITWASVWYGVIGPWCAMAVTRAYVEAGSKVFARGSRYAYCPYIVADARAGRNHLAITKAPQKGDLVLFDWDNDGVADHIGLFEEWIAPSRFRSIEGNTGIGNDSNGGEVMRRERFGSDVACFVHVGA